jgi:hypothetical protein
MVNHMSTDRLLLWSCGIPSYAMDLVHEKRGYFGIAGQTQPKNKLKCVVRARPHLRSSPPGEEGHANLLG